MIAGSVVRRMCDKGITFFTTKGQILTMGSRSRFYVAVTDVVRDASMNIGLLIDCEGRIVIFVTSQPINEFFEPVE